MTLPPRRRGTYPGARTVFPALKADEIILASVKGDVMTKYVNGYHQYRRATGQIIGLALICVGFALMAGALIGYVAQRTPDPIWRLASLFPMGGVGIAAYWLWRSFLAQQAMGRLIADLRWIARRAGATDQQLEQARRKK